MREGRSTARDRGRGLSCGLDQAAGKGLCLSGLRGGSPQPSEPLSAPVLGSGNRGPWAREVPRRLPEAISEEGAGFPRPLPGPVALGRSLWGPRSPGSRGGARR